VHDPVDIRRRIDRLAARIDRRDDYGRLLARGDVVRRIEDVEDVDAWRDEIKRQARADRIKVRTGANEHIAYAYIAGGLMPEREAEADRYTDIMRRAVPLAVLNRHEPAPLIRDGDEVVCKCDRCSALGYIHAEDDVIGGELFEDDCPHEEDPGTTALGLMYYGRGPTA
jgi:hypothetical protein